MLLFQGCDGSRTVWQCRYLATQSCCESAEAPVRTALCEAVRWEAGLLTECHWKGAVVELVGSN